MLKWERIRSDLQNSLVPSELNTRFVSKKGNNQGSSREDFVGKLLPLLVREVSSTHDWTYLGKKFEQKIGKNGGFLHDTHKFHECDEDTAILFVGTDADDRPVYCAFMPLAVMALRLEFPEGYLKGAKESFLNDGKLLAARKKKRLRGTHTRAHAHRIAVIERFKPVVDVKRDDLLLFDRYPDDVYVVFDNRIEMKKESD